LKTDFRGGWDDVTGGNGLLATANDRLTFLILLGWIHPSVYADLRLLKSIRNRFAHHADVSNFEDAIVRSWIGAFSITEKPILEEAHNIITSAGKPGAQQLYLMRSALVVTQLVANLAVAPEARALRIAPGHVERQEWEHLPSNPKELKRIAAEVIVAVANEASPNPL